LGVVKIQRNHTIMLISIFHLWDLMSLENRPHRMVHTDPHQHM
jgi:hypothetical protein